MALKPAFGLQQTQSLVMTPQLLQSIKLLQFNNAELDQYISSEIERNPLLTRDDGPAPESNVIELRPRNDAEAISERLDTSLENLFPDDPGRRDPISPDLSAQWRSAGGAAHAASFDGDWNPEAFVATPRTLREDLQEQILLIFKDPAQRFLALHLADSLEDSGYLTDFDELPARTGASRAELEKVLRTLQQNIEPSGLFARSLSECLAIQLRARGRLDPAMEALLQNLDLLARRDFAALRKICGVDESDLVDMLSEIRMLDPKPGAAFLSEGSEPITPDVIVSAAPDGTWRVELNEDAVPRVLVDQSYCAKVSSQSRKQDQTFISECLQNANWLIRALDQRSKSILKVASEIVRQQDAFLAHGVNHLRPLKLRTIADIVGMHESTVSRITANKFMLTPRGVFEMRYFFTAAIAAADGGDAHSAEAVRNRIRQLIDQETAANVLSDDALVDILKEEGIDIARRTVAKYREGMSIPSSVQRRREKRARTAQK